MSSITQEGKLEFTTVADAQRFVRNLGGRPRFQVSVRCFLPTEGDRGFEGSTCISISRQEFIKVLGDVGRTFVDKRGAHIKLDVTPAKEIDGLSFVYLY